MQDIDMWPHAEGICAFLVAVRKSWNGLPFTPDSLVEAARIFVTGFGQDFDQHFALAQSIFCRDPQLMETTVLPTPAEE